MCDQNNKQTKIRHIPLLVSVMSELLARRLWMNPVRPSLGEQQTARKVVRGRQSSIITVKPTKASTTTKAKKTKICFLF